MRCIADERFVLACSCFSFFPVLALFFCLHFIVKPDVPHDMVPRLMLSTMLSTTWLSNSHDMVTCAPRCFPRHPWTGNDPVVGNRVTMSWTTLSMSCECRPMKGCRGVHPNLEWCRGARRGARGSQQHPAAAQAPCSHAQGALRCRHC